MQKLIDDIESELKEFHDSPAIEDLLERCKAELAKYRWIPATPETMPEENGEYLCKMVDDREDESDDEWMEICEFKKSKAFGDKFQSVNFDRVVEWTHIIPTE